MTDEKKNAQNSPSIVHGLADKVAGTVQKGVGKLINDRDLEAEGAAKAAKGEVELDAARKEMKQEGERKEAAGKAKRLEGDQREDLGMEASGAIEELAGKVKKAVNS
jgi:uncharacterized protein YjbJ (UPF0337 family)